MSVDRLDKDLSAVRLADKFDRMLSQALHKHSEPVPAGFTARLLRQIKQAEEQRILARVVLQERLALAACIALAGTVVVLGSLFPDFVVTVFRSIAAGATARGEVLIERIPQTIEAFGGQWRLYTILAAALGFAIYSLVELLVGDRATMA
jgi:hypothetical protein